VTDDTRRERVKSRIDASQKRKQQGGGHRRPPERPQTLGHMIDQYPALMVAGGVVAGALLGALLPRGAGRKLVQRSTALAAVGAELAAVYGRHALEAAETASREGRERLGEFGETLGGRLESIGGRAAELGGTISGRAAELGGTIGGGAARAGHRAAQVAGEATTTARDAGRTLARKAIDLAASARR
jgi:hypothetical protein